MGCRFKTGERSRVDYHSHGLVNTVNRISHQRCLILICTAVVSTTKCRKKDKTYDQYFSTPAFVLKVISDHYVSRYVDPSKTLTKLVFERCSFNFPMFFWSILRFYLMYVKSNCRGHFHIFAQTWTGEFNNES